MESTQWFYLKKGQQRGPVDTGDLASLIHSGVLPPDTLVFTSTQADWIPANTTGVFPLKPATLTAGNNTYKKRRAIAAVVLLFLMLGGYISGTSLIGAPLIIAVAAQHVAREKLRDTLFVLWFVLVSIKMAAFVWAGVDLQLIHHLWLLPCVTVGHLIGLRFHHRMLHNDSGQFFRVLGVTLLVTSAVGLGKVFMT